MSKPSDITTCLGWFGRSSRLGTQAGEHKRQLPIALSSLLSVGWHLPFLIWIPRVKTCNSPLLRSCSAPNMHQTLLGGRVQKHPCEPGDG